MIAALPEAEFTDVMTQPSSYRRGDHLTSAYAILGVENFKLDPHVETLASTTSYTDGLAHFTEPQILEIVTKLIKKREAA